MSREFPIALLKNLPFEITSLDIYQLCSKYGKVLQVRRGTEQHLKGNCFVIFDNLETCTKAVEQLNGINFKGRYLVALHYIVDNALIEEVKRRSRGEQEVNGELDF